MKNFLKYPLTVISSFAYATTVFAQTLKLPTPPPSSQPGVRASDIVNIITTGVNYLITVSVVIAVAAFVYGGIKFALGDPKAKDILKNAAIGLVAILGVGLLITTIAGWLSRGLQLG